MESSSRAPRACCTFLKASSPIAGLGQIPAWPSSHFWCTSTKSRCALIPQNLLRKIKTKIFNSPATANKKLCPISSHYRCHFLSPTNAVTGRFLCSEFCSNKEIKAGKSEKPWRFYDVLKVALKISHVTKTLCPIQTVVPKAIPRKQGQGRNDLRT